MAIYATTACVTSQDWVAIIGAIAAGVAMILAAIGALWVRVHGYQQQIDGRMTELLAITRKSAMAEGRETERSRGPHPP
jgi:allantoicase